MAVQQRDDVGLAARPLVEELEDVEVLFLHAGEVEENDVRDVLYVDLWVFPALLLDFSCLHRNFGNVFEELRSYY